MTSGQLLRRHPRLSTAFFAVAVVLVLHESEHLAQVLQKDVRGDACPNDCRGLLGFFFDIEWVHVAYNHSLLLLLAALYAGFRMWRREWRAASPVGWALLTGGIFLLQGYHVVEHTVKLDQWFGNGHHSPTPGILGQPLPAPDGRNFSLIELHFVFNTLVFLAVLGGYLAYGFHRHIWAGSRRRGLTVAAAAGAGVLVFTGSVWSMRPPTIQLPAGVTQGPLLLDHAQTLVGRPDSVVRGGIRITADEVTLKDVNVVANEYGIDVDDARSIVLQNVSVRGATIDAIHIRRAQVVIRDCTIGGFRGGWGQGIDISFSAHRRMSLIERCTITGGREGIVTHSANVLVRNNRITRTSLRGIAMTEMSMGEVAGNRVDDALGVGIFCGDFSHCMISGNHVSGTRPDPASGDLTRMGYALQANYGAHATLHRNRLVGNALGASAFFKAQLSSRP